MFVLLQMFDWISHNKEVFLQSHTEIGRSYQHAVELQTQHNHFAMNSMVSEAFTVCGHTSASRISLIITQLMCDQCDDVCQFISTQPDVLILVLW